MSQLERPEHFERLRRGRPREGKGGMQKTILIYPIDDRMLNELKDHFGVDSRSDVIRTAIRTLYVNLLGKSNV